MRGGIRFDGVARKHEARADLPERNAGGLQQHARRAGPALADDVRSLGGRQFIGADGTLGCTSCGEGVEVCVIERSDAKFLVLFSATR